MLSPSSSASQSRQQRVTRSLNQFHSLSIAGDLWSKRKSDDAGVKSSYRAEKPCGIDENVDVSIRGVTIGTKIFMVQIGFRTGQPFLS